MDRNLPSRDVNWEVAKTRLTTTKKEGRVIYLGSRAALSTAPGATAPSKPSKYQDVFKQGATIVPRSVYFVKVNDLDGKVDSRAYWAETEPEQAAQAKKPYDDVKMSGLSKVNLFTVPLCLGILSPMLWSGQSRSCFPLRRNTERCMSLPPTN